MSARGIVRQCLAMVVAVSFCLAPAAVKGAEGTKAKIPTITKVRSPKHVTVNRHLHVPHITSGLVRKAKPSTSTHSKRHHVRRPTASLSGTIRDAKGSAASGVSVKLAKANGKKIRNARARHTTTTSSGGTYTMRAVKAGRYRVVASKTGAGSGHKGVGIKAGKSHHADVKLSTGKPKKHRKK
jgi:hypothetical protein